MAHPWKNTLEVVLNPLPLMDMDVPSGPPGGFMAVMKGAPADAGAGIRMMYARKRNGMR
ncbi:MAG TPA: hypothetical protein PLR71_10865 [Deltaproteobacteria bacterium]|nr:hypothetical protein [Deltaproteobacteria bacterium]